MQQFSLPDSEVLAVFPLTLWLIGKWPNFLQTIVPKRRLYALILRLIEY